MLPTRNGISAKAINIMVNVLHATTTSQQLKHFKLEK